MEGLVDHGAVERLHRVAVHLDVVRVDGRPRRDIESRLHQRRARQHEQLRVVLRFDLRVRHARQELHPAVHHHAADMACRAREEHAVHRSRRAEPGPILLPVVLVVDGLQFGRQQERLLRQLPRAEPCIHRDALHGVERSERLRILECESVRQCCRPCRPGDTVVVVVRPRTDPDVIHGPGFAARRVRHSGLPLPDARNRAQRRIPIVGIEIEDGLQQHVGNAVEANGVVVEPLPRQLRVLTAAKAVLLRPSGIGVVQISLDCVIPFLDLGVPVRHRRAIDPRHDVGGGVVLQRHDEAALGGIGCGLVFRSVVAGLPPAGEKGDGQHQSSGDALDVRHWSSREGSRSAKHYQ